MSFRSFDKFCEKLILTEPGSEKEILDERQKIVRTKIIAETLLIFAFAEMLNCIIMDYFYKWAESYSPPLLLILMACLIYYIIRNAAQGSYVGINGNFARKVTSVTIILIAVLNITRHAFDLADGGILTDGALSDAFLFAASFALLAVCGVISLVVLRSIDKADSSKIEEKEERS